MAEETEVVVSEQTTDTEVEKVEQSTTDEQQSQETQEPTFEVDGEKLTASQIKKLREDFKNDSEWKKKNTLESQRIAEQRKELEPLLALKPYLEQRPEIVQQLFQPKQERNIDAELDQLYTQKPDMYDTQAMAMWERQKDVLIATKIATETQKTIYNQSQMQQAVSHNDEIYNSAKEQFKDKVSDAEFQEMTNYIKNNYVANQGKYSKNVFERAYKELHEDKWLREIKLGASRDAIKPLLKTTTSAKDNGTRVSKTDDEDLSEKDKKLAEYYKAHST